MRRLSIDVTDEQHEELSKIFPWGTKRPFFSVLIDNIIELSKTKNGHLILGALFKGSITLKEAFENDSR